MRHAFLLRMMLALVLAVPALLPQALVAAPVQDPTERPVYVPGEVVIGWQPGNGPVPAIATAPDRLGTDRESPSWQAVATTISRATRLTVLDARPEYGTARLSAPVGTEEAQIERLEALPWVRYAELNYYAYAEDAAYPADPDFGRQWNMHRIQAPEAWFMTRGSRSFVVAVLDTGVAQGHPEFAGQLLEGYNYVAVAPGAEDDDPYSHGTHVTGILAARMNNGQGVAGLAPDIKILPLKVLDSQRKGRYDAIGAALRDAADRRAQVINLSMAGPASQLLQDAVKYAQDQGSLVVAAGGNCAQDPANCWGQVNPDIYPAAYSRVLAVSASDRFDRPAFYSGYKPYIGLAAPGGTADEPVWSTIRSGYGPLYGTSMSTPLVCAAAALVWTLRPAATADEVANILKNTADKVGSDPYTGQPLSYASGRNDYFGSGRLNAANAVRWAYPPSLVPSTGQVSFLLGGATTWATRSIPITNPSGQSVNWQAIVTSPTPWLKLDFPAGGTSVYGSSASLTVRAERQGQAPGVYYGAISVQPVGRPDVPAVILTVTMRVTATLHRAFAPLLTQRLGFAWLDPDAPDNLYYYKLPLTNDGIMSVPLPFPVTFYGASQQILQVSDNGFVIFGPANGATGRTPAECPGNALPPNNAIYVLANDWNPSLGGQIVVHRPDSSTYVVTWQDVRRTGNSLPQSFQLVISSDGTFRGNYRLVESPLPGIIGGENYDATFPQQILCNGAGQQVKSGESVRFNARLPW